MKTSLEQWAQALFNAKVSLVSYNPVLRIAALHKPSGVISHPNSTQQQGKSKPTACLLKGHYNFDQETYSISHGGEDYKCWLLHRLDKDTSGVILVSLDSDVAKAVKSLFKDRKVQKEYTAVVFGQFKGKDRVVWQDECELRKVHDGSAIRVFSGTGLSNSLAITNVKLVRYLPKLNVSVLKMMPRTGYAHQLRYQCAVRGLPIVGDEVYGSFPSNKKLLQIMKKKYSSSPDFRVSEVKRLFLHAKAVGFELEHEGQRNEFRATCPLPRAFEMIKSL